MINVAKANSYFQIPFSVQEKSSFDPVTFASVTKKFAEIRKAKETCAENTLNFTFRAISTPILWTNRALKLTYILSSMKPFADFLMIIQPILSQVLSKMLIVCGVVYAVSLFRYFSSMVLQHDFRSNIHDYSKSSIFNMADTTFVFERINALKEHVQTIFKSDTDHRHTLAAIEDLDRILQYTPAYDMSVTIQIQKVQQAILLDGLIYLKTYNQSLENRITPWMTDQLHFELDFLINALSTGDIYAKNYAQVRVQHLFAQIDKEAQKIFVSHIFGTLMVITNIAGTITAFVLSSGLVPLILFCLSYLFMGVEYTIYYGSSRKEGWAFDLNGLKDCIPHFVRYGCHEFAQQCTRLASRVTFTPTPSWGHLSSQIHFKMA